MSAGGQRETRLTFQWRCRTSSGRRPLMQGWGPNRKLCRKTGSFTLLPAPYSQPGHAPSPLPIQFPHLSHTLDLSSHLPHTHSKLILPEKPSVRVWESDWA